MKKYSIEVLEVLSRIVEVEASDAKEAIEKDDRETLVKLLDDGKKRKEEVDG